MTDEIWLFKVSGCSLFVVVVVVARSVVAVVEFSAEKSSYT